MGRELVSRLWVLMAATLLAGCASSGNTRDPGEHFNRVMFALNDGLDVLVVKPVARGYDAVLPRPVKTGVSNFFSNIEDVLVGVNSVLQGKVDDGARDLGRFVVNSTVGVLGLIDVATEMGLEKHDEDFGQTFGRWGVGPGPYVVLPVFGPRTVRDTVGFVLDSTIDPVSQAKDPAVRNSLTMLRLVNKRVELLPADKVIEEAALDRYAYVRDAYLQRRLNLVHDGNPPRRDLDDE